MTPEEIQRSVLANVSPRYKRLEAIESWVDCTQYAGRPDWWTGGAAKVPLWERAPCIVYPLVRIAIQSNVDLCLGADKFPSFEIEQNGGDLELEGEEPEESDSAAHEYLEEYHKASRFASHCREALAAAQGCGTAVAVHGVRRGKPFNELYPAKWCEAEWRDGEIVKLTIRYPYVEESQAPDGTWESKVRLYRRIITAESDTVFLPALADSGGREPAWVVDMAQSSRNTLGFCPVVWYAHMKGCQAANVVDGRALHESLTDEIQAHDIARSQWHKVALYSDPQIAEIGVTRGYNPTNAKGRTARVPATANGGLPGRDNPITASYAEAAPAAEGARIKGPGTVWQYENPETKVQVLTTPSDALVAQKDNTADLRIKLQESLRVVFLDPENIKFAATTSGKALQAIKQKQLDACDQYRDDFAENFIIPSIVVQLRITKAVGAGIKIPGVKDALAELGDDIIDPSITVKYGDYFAPDPAEQLQIVNLVMTALKDTPIISRKVAIEKVAEIFDISNVDRLLAELESDAASDMAKETKRLEAEATAYHNAANPEAVNNGANPRANRSGRGSEPATTPES